MGNQSWRHALLTKTDKSVQVFQVDLNYGSGDRIQLTYEVPLVWQSAMCDRAAECDGMGQWPARYQVAVAKMAAMFRRFRNSKSVVWRILSKQGGPMARGFSCHSRSVRSSVH